MVLAGAGGALTAHTPAASAQGECTAPAWNPGAVYNQGDVVSHNGRTWRATHWMWPGVQPGVNESPPWWVPWEDLGPCSPGTTTTTTQPGSTTTTTQPDPGESVDDHYTAEGPWATTSLTASAPGTPGVLVVYPEDLGANGYDHPVLTFGTGTILEPDPCGLTEQNGGPFSHFASWGYVLVCANTGFSGSGNEILSAAQWLVDQDSNPNSAFFDNLDTSKVGAIGGSQGAAGVVNAMTQSDGLITSTYAWALVDPWALAAVSTPVPNFAQVQDPLFFASGTTDGFTSQESQQDYYDEVPGPAGKAALVGNGHEGGADTSYAVAWFKYTLEGDQFARSAFAGSSPELASNPAWTNWASKNLP